MHSTENEEGEPAIRYLRLTIAILFGRFVGWLSRLGGHGGSSLPGKLALRWHPHLLQELRQRAVHGTVLVTGTNGKTTTTAMARSILTRHAWSVINNHNGANLIAGLATAFMGQGRILGRADLALLEVDEATMPRASAELKPRMIVVTNVFRDQLDRYGELSTTLRFIQRAVEDMAEDGQLVLNADDPQVAYLGRDRPHVVYFGLEADGNVGSDPGRTAYDASDSTRCPRCGHPLEYFTRFYAHLGHYRCGACGHERPQPTIRVAQDKAGTITLMGDFGWVPIDMPIPGLYNLYNLAAAAALTLTLGVHVDLVPAAIVSMVPAFGRMESIVAENGTVLRLALVKNPVGFNQVLDTMVQSPEGNHALVVINDRYADGRDVSWLWDVNFESELLQRKIGRWWVSGIRAWDMAVRLKYAGIEPSKIVVLASAKAALDAALAESRDCTLYVMPTYTALLEVRDLLTRRGLVKHFREG